MRRRLAYVATRAGNGRRRGSPLSWLDLLVRLCIRVVWAWRRMRRCGQYPGA